MSTTHRNHHHACRWPGCPAVVSTKFWGCSVHWYALPNNIRAWLGRSYRQGIEQDIHPSRSYVAANKAALAWIAQHFEAEAQAPREREEEHTT